MNQPTEQQREMCRNNCGEMGKTGFHSLLCPLSGVDHPSRPGNTYRPETIAEARTQIGNTPSCEDCGEQHGESDCEDRPGAMTEEEKTELRLDAEDDAERGCAKCGGEFEAPIHSVAKNSHQFIDLTPVGCQTPEGSERVRKAQQEWDDATHELANTLKRVIDEVFDRDTDKIARAEYYSDLQTLIGIRESKQDAFLRAVAGASERPKLKTYPATVNGKTVQVTIPEN